MDILKMTYVSYFLTGIAVMSGITAVTLFFLYDIPRCLRIVRGGQICKSFAGVTVHKQKKNVKESVRHGRTRKLTLAEKTEKLDLNVSKPTVLLTDEDTTLLETMYLVQDITMIEAQL